MTRALAILVALFAIGCGASSEPKNPVLGSWYPPPVPLPGRLVGFDRIGAPGYPGVSLAGTDFPAPERLVIRTQAAWEATWQRRWSGAAPWPAPAVDFTTELVVGSAMGTQLTGGYFTEVTSASLDGATLHVGVVEVSPGNCGVTTALRQPVAFARVARHDGDVQFTTAAFTVDCE